MPKNKKRWIDKKTADTYLVIHRNQDGPDDASGPREQKKTDVSKGKDVEEHIKCGIYFDDDYDYMKHLRDLNEVSILEKLEKPAVSRITVGKPPLDIFEDESAEQGQLEECEDFDSEVEAALEGNFNFEDPENALEDDFIFRANDGILPSTCSPGKNFGHRGRAESFGEEDEKEFEEEDFNGDVGFEESDLDNYPEDFNDEAMEEVSCAKNKTTEQRLIDEQFEHLCDEYDEDGLNEDEEEAAEALIDPDSNRLKELVEERKRNRTELVLQPDDVARKFGDEDSGESQEQLEDITVEPLGPKKAKWDCESVLSTYSNIYNRPCLIKEPSRKQRLKSFLKKADEDYEMEEVCSKAPSTLARSKDETREERKIRKAVVKDQRRERRVEKKCNKLAFKAERLKQQTQQSGVSVKMTPIT